MIDGKDFDEISNVRHQFHCQTNVVDFVCVSFYVLMNVENLRRSSHCLEMKIQVKYFPIKIDDDDTMTNLGNLFDGDDDNDLNST